MNIILIIAGLFILCCSAITYFKAAEQVLVKNPGKTSFTLAALLACMGYVQLAMGLFFTGVVGMVPRELFFAGLVAFIMAAYLAAALAYLYYRSLVSSPPGKEALHFVPAAVVMTLLTPYLLTRSEEYRTAVYLQLSVPIKYLKMRPVIHGT